MSYIIWCKAEDGKGGFYHLDRVTEIAYSGTTHMITVKYLVKWSLLRPDGSYAQYGV